MCAPEDEERQIEWEPDRARWEPVNPTQTMASPKAAQMSRKFAAFLLVLTFCDSFVVWVCASDVEEHLSVGMTLLAKGQYSDALSHFHAAIDADPTNYMSYYKRATVFLALSRSRPALADLDKVLQLKSDFIQAKAQRANVLLKMGRLDEAHIDAENVLRKDPEHEDAQRVYGNVEVMKERLQDADAHFKHRNYQAVVDLLSEVVDVIPWDPSVRDLRAEAYIGLGNNMHAISDIRTTTKLRSDDTAGFMRLSVLHYHLGEAEESLNEVRECLRLDPDHKDCFTLYKKLKKVAKFVVAAREARNSEEWDDCKDAAKKILKNEAEVEDVRFHAHDHLCRCHLKSGESTEAVKQCSEAIRIRGNEEPRLYCDRAEAHLDEDLYDEAVRDYRKALDIDDGFQAAKEGLNTAQKRQKQASKRDYYKILGVKRSDRKKDILKAYRKLAQKWHPDNFQDEDEKKKAEKKFMDIASAKEVLTDQEMREKYDRGEDPLDPEQKNGGHHGGHPFHGHPFGGGGGGPFQFKFHFN